jgi:hypothetical protein
MQSTCLNGRSVLLANGEMSIEVSGIFRTGGEFL